MTSHGQVDRGMHLTLASLVPDEVLRALAIALVLRLGVQQARGIHACDRPDSGVCSRVEKAQLVLAHQVQGLEGSQRLASAPPAPAAHRPSSACAGSPAARLPSAQQPLPELTVGDRNAGMRTDRVSGGGRRMVSKQPAQVQVFLQSSVGQRTSKPNACDNAAPGSGAACPARPCRSSAGGASAALDATASPDAPRLAPENHVVRPCPLAAQGRRAYGRGRG